MQLVQFVDNREHVLQGESQGPQVSGLGTRGDGHSVRHWLRYRILGD